LKWAELDQEKKTGTCIPIRVISKKTYEASVHIQNRRNPICIFTTKKKLLRANQNPAKWQIVNMHIQQNREKIYLKLATTHV
jgi:hypothetical protein